MRVAKAPFHYRLDSLLKVLVCLLLAGLFLYNPYLSAGDASARLTVCHPASYRATVASCEIEQFAPPSASFTLAPPEFDSVLLQVPRAATCESEPRNRVDSDVEATPQTGFSSSLWFRPPPAV